MGQSVSKASPRSSRHSTRNGSLLDLQYTEGGQSQCTVGCPHIAKEIQLKDNSYEEVEGVPNRFEADLEEEYATRAKLQHHNVVCAQGVHLDSTSHSPVLVMEKMDTRLRTFLEDHSKEFPLHLKASLLRQLAQVFANLHSPYPMAYILNPSNTRVLMKLLSYLSSVCSKKEAILSSTRSQRLSETVFLQFMPPEALESPPHYTEEQDAFSFGNIILSSTMGHVWPNPVHSIGYKSDTFVAVVKLPLHKHDLESFTAQEKQQFLPIELCRKKSLCIVLGGMKFAIFSPPPHETLSSPNMDWLTMVFNKEYLQQIAVIERQRQNWVVLDPTEVEISIARSLGNFPAAHTVHVPHTV